MRKLILIAAALVLASASAQAGDSRGLTLASSDEPAAAAPAQPTEAPAVAAAKPAADTPAAAETVKAEAPKYVDRPAPVGPAAKSDLAKPDSAKPVAVQSAKSDKSKRRPYWTEARIIGELHRHGVYW